MEIVIGDAEIGPPNASGYVEMVAISARQNSFIFFGAKEVYCLNCTVLLCQMSEVPFESWLRRLRTGDLNTLAKSLETLLLPEHCCYYKRLGSRHHQ